MYVTGMGEVPDYLLGPQERSRLQDQASASPLTVAPTPPSLGSQLISGSLNPGSPGVSPLLPGMAPTDRSGSSAPGVTVAPNAPNLSGSDPTTGVSQLMGAYGTAGPGVGGGPTSPTVAAPSKTGMVVDTFPGPGAESSGETALPPGALPADPSKGQGTAYYPLYTNSGDWNGSIGLNGPDQQVRVLDSKTGEVMYEGKGDEAAAQAAQIANQNSQDRGRKAQWQVETAGPDNNWAVSGYDRKDPKHSFLGPLLTIVGSILAPYLAPALAGGLGISTGLARVLVAGAGGAGGGAVNGGLKGALLGGLTSGLGYGLGDKLTAGLNNATAAAGGSAYTGVGPDQLAGVLNRTIGNPADFLNSGTVSGLTAVAGGGAGSVTGGLAGGLAGGALNQALTQTPQGQQPGEVSPLEVTARPDPVLGTESLTSIPGALLNSDNPAWESGLSKNPIGSQQSQVDAMNRTQLINSTLGQVGGSLGAGYTVGTLASLLAQQRDNFSGNPDGGGDTPKTDGPPVINTPGKTAPGGAPGAGGGGKSGAPGSNAMGASPAISGATAGDANLDSSFAPDIYPWKKLAEPA